MDPDASNAPFLEPATEPVPQGLPPVVIASEGEAIQDRHATVTARPQAVAVAMTRFFAAVHGPFAVSAAPKQAAPNDASLRAQRSNLDCRRLRKTPLREAS